MRNIWVNVPHKEKEAFAGKLKLIWQAGTAEDARTLASQLAENYRNRFPITIDILEEGLGDSLGSYPFPALDSRKISSNNLRNV